MRTLHSVGLICLLVAGAACSSGDGSVPKTTRLSGSAAALSASAPLQSGGGSPTLDLGSTDPTEVVSVSIVFKARPIELLEAYVQATQDPASPFYHQFLSVADFASSFAPSSADIARVASYVGSFGIQVGSTLADNLVLKATGTVGAFTQAFSFQMHDFQSGSTRYHRPLSPPSMPSSLGDVMLVVAGFSTQPAYVPKSMNVEALAPGLAPKAVLPSNGTATGVPGSYTVGDFANQYGVNPLYKAGIDGAGSTIGVATLAGFDPQDAYTYWSSIGLKVRDDRITQVHVDGGAPVSDQGGSGETTLDVEESGGIAPKANIIVYDAPNTDGGFLDVFYTAASDNLVDSLSVSWGQAEIFYYNTILTGADLTAELQAFHQVFLEGAAQGISMFAASGDSGAYDTSGLVPGLSNPLTVDSPASDPAITAAGGTTTPYSINGAALGDPSITATFSVTQEQVWGWDSLQAYLNANDFPPNGNAWSLFSTGGGGGVSVYWPVPDYQRDYPGIRRSEPGQILTLADSTGDATQTLLTLPAGFAGRNVPDLAADADPFSGYEIYVDGGWSTGWGGTSFVAPQMNGVSALVRQRVGGRVGLWNAMLYRFAISSRHATVDVTSGDNWFYDGIRGYDPASGVGRIDAAAFANAVADECGAR